MNLETAINWQVVDIFTDPKTWPVSACDKCSSNVPVMGTRPDVKAVLSLSGNQVRCTRGRVLQVGQFHSVSVGTKKHARDGRTMWDANSGSVLIRVPAWLEGSTKRVWCLLQGCLAGLGCSNGGCVRKQWTQLSVQVFNKAKYFDLSGHHPASTCNIRHNGENSLMMT